MEGNLTLNQHPDSGSKAEKLTLLSNFYKSDRNILINFALGYLRNRNDGEDCVQESFSKAVANIDKFNAYIKTNVHNEPVKPFSLDLTKDMTQVNAARNPDIARAIIQLSRLKYGQPRELIEAEITERARL